MLIEYKNVRITQLDGKTVLEGVNLHVNEGEFVYLTGRVGSGKSSLLKTMYCELDIDRADEAIVLGTDLMKIRRKHIPDLRRQMGIIFQDFQLLADRSVYKNLLFVLKATGWKKAEDMDNRIIQVLSDVDMLDRRDRMPHELSGGEQQRIAIARALLNSPKLIIADEPTANLDAETAQGIMQLLRQIAQTGTAVIMSTHNTQLLSQFPGVEYCCNEGLLIDKTNKKDSVESEEEQV